MEEENSSLCLQKLATNKQFILVGQILPVFMRSLILTS